MAACGRSAADPRPIADAREALKAGIPAEVTEALKALEAADIGVLEDGRVVVIVPNGALTRLDECADELPLPQRALIKADLKRYRRRLEDAGTAALESRKIGGGLPVDLDDDAQLEHLPAEELAAYIETAQRALERLEEAERIIKASQRNMTASFRVNWSYKAPRSEEPHGRILRPRAAQREARPRRAAARSSLGARAGQDPGSSGGDDDPPDDQGELAEVIPFPRRPARPATYTFGCISACERGAEVVA